MTPPEVGDFGRSSSADRTPTENVNAYRKPVHPSVVDDQGASPDLDHDGLTAIIRAGWPSTLRLIALLVVPLAIVAWVAPSVAVAMAVPLVTGVLWLLRGSKTRQLPPDRSSTPSSEKPVRAESEVLGEIAEIRS
ncbi:hypothetical protein FHX82_003301 [Amycolatopsis bartoniae]|nr:hypothetical protein [Amycolatopsis bartoniae]MBB2936247.1 hypothetical protein [Amycolatopsis bartoniae]TVT11592.1 hypothetical protein FNH07_01900 [Amycolatopsis bartoniae]